MEIGAMHSAESKAKMRAAQLGRRHTLQTRLKIAASNRRRVLSPETKAKLAVGFLGRHHTEEARAKLRLAMLKRYESPLERARTAATSLGRFPSAATRAKISANRLGKGLGPLSQQVRMKMSAARKGRRKSAEMCAKLSATRLAMYASNSAFRERQIGFALAAAFASMRGRRHEYLDTKERLWRFRSSWELRFAQALDRSTLTWWFEPDRLLLPDGRTYIPDFWVADWSCYVEIKGRLVQGDLPKHELAHLAGYPMLTLCGGAALDYIIRRLDNSRGGLPWKPQISSRLILDSSP